MSIFFRNKNALKGESNIKENSTSSMSVKKRPIKNLQDKIDDLYEKLSDRNFDKFTEIVASPKKLFWRSFLAGIARGIGSAIGFSILGAILIYLLRYIVMLNLPVIGAFIKDIWEIVQNK